MQFDPLYNQAQKNKSIEIHEIPMESKDARLINIPQNQDIITCHLLKDETM